MYQTEHITMAVALLREVDSLLNITQLPMNVLL